MAMERFLTETLDTLRFAHPALLSPQKLWSRKEVLSSPSIVPAAPGVYAWYFKRAPANAPTEDCPTFEGKVLLYVGSPKAPTLNGKPPSRQEPADPTAIPHARKRRRLDATPNVRLLLLSDELGLQLRRVAAARG